LTNPTHRVAAEIVVADIGSTITKLSAFAGMGDGARHPPRFLGQGIALTTTAEGDVSLGLVAARRDLEERVGIPSQDAMLMACSSAAGGLRMTVHGLTRDMTLRAAREASLGAGAIVSLATAGPLGAADVTAIREARPRLVLLAGGVDQGDRDTVLANAWRLAALGPIAPVIYAGNVAARAEVERILGEAGVQLFTVDNVYPRIDELNIEPVRALIQDVFARHIVTAPGMNAVRAWVTGRILPTPGAVLRATELVAQTLGDVMTVDVGGATTDVHSVTGGSDRYRGLAVAPEPHSKRTVEGDLGVYLNAEHLAQEAARPIEDLDALSALPRSARARRLATALTRLAVDIAVWRHAGTLRVGYGTPGRSEWVEGRDLTAVRHVLGTGGALARLPGAATILASVRRDPARRKLLPPQDARVLIDRHYVLAALGVLSQSHLAQARLLAAQSLASGD
jgi:uncharacterized protein (TIGR01319 family)